MVIKARHGPVHTGEMAPAQPWWGGVGVLWKLLALEGTGFPSKDRGAGARAVESCAVSVSVLIPEVLSMRIRKCLALCEVGCGPLRILPAGALHEAGTLQLWVLSLPMSPCSDPLDTQGQFSFPSTARIRWLSSSSVNNSHY